MKLQFRFVEIWQVFLATVKSWKDSPAMTVASSVAYYAIFSIPGLIIILMTVAGFFFDKGKIDYEVNRYITSAMGSGTAESFEDIIEESAVGGDNILLQIFGIAALVFGASTLFFRMQKSFNDIWEIDKAPKKALLRFLLDRASSLGMVIVIAFLLMISMLASSVIALVNNWLMGSVGLEMYSLIQIANFVVSFLVTMVLFAIMFKVLPDAKIPWKTVWAGAILTAILFTIGKTLLSLYFVKFKPASAFGAAGSVLLAMMWVNYTCILLFFGVEFTKRYAQKRGHDIQVAAHAKWNEAKRFRMLNRDEVGDQA